MYFFGSQTLMNMKLISLHVIAIVMFIVPGQFKSGIQSTVNSTKQVDNNTRKGHYVGEVFGGGVVFFVDKDENGKEYGFIVSLQQLSSDAVWGPFKNVPDCESRGNGAANTEAIMKNGGSSTDAAGLCAGYSSGGFDDWYLPSLEELKDLGRNVEAVNKTLKKIKKGAQVIETKWFHWSSTEVKDDSRYDPVTTAAYCAPDPKSITPYGSTVGNKKEKMYVRAVRAF